ncbi:cytochrome oxidase small assembly protein [Accumulibacter sp.]|nr:cytochrome oxidase small assembly protein [Accumulibacter sp.]MCB1941636.1 cytochrome oxidase small assembly protein [Accumulibacter sp.]
MTHDPSREQNSRRIAIGLALFAAAVFLSFVIRQWLANT